MKNPSGHICPKCQCELVYNKRFSMNKDGVFYNLYGCANCGHEFESKQSHEEADAER